MNRKKFLLNSAAIVPGFMMLPEFMSAKPQQTPEPYKMDLVKEFVVAGHGTKDGDLDKVKSMLQDYPNMIFTKYDWGNGDYEAAIEGAGHMGNKEIAEYLIVSGSRVTLFVLAMLGKTELVQPVLEQYPPLIFAKGPHGFTMLHHAKVAGKNGEALYAWLQEKGLKDTWVKIK